MILNKTQDLDIVEDLLKQNNLPYQDIKMPDKEFFLAYDSSLFVGLAGLEKFGNIGFLRSVAVKEEQRSKGYGERISLTVLHYARNQGIEEVFLLTSTAAKFFEKIGFKLVDRSFVPDVIKSTTEFSELCPNTAVCLKMAI